MLIDVIINKKETIIPNNSTVSNMLKYINSPNSVAIFINGKQLLMAEYEHYVIKDNDEIRIIRPLGGG